MMKFIPTPLQGAFIIEPDFLADERGGFMRTFCKTEFKAIRLDIDFVQINHSFNKKKGTLRGMHFQLPPFSEEKLIRCIQGAVYDVIIDIRKNSSTFLDWFAVDLSAENKKMIYVPQGFAHGFQTVEDNTELLYHHTGFYNKDAESGIKYNDEMIGVNWMEEISMISEKDKNYQLLDTDFNGIEL